MANTDQDFKLINIEGDDDEVVFHAGMRTSESAPSAPSADAGQAGRVPASPISEDDAPAAGAGEMPNADDAADPHPVNGAAAAEDDESRQAPKTAMERQGEKRRAERRQMAEELAATEADLHKAGKMSAAQVITIIVCIVLLIVGIVYVVQTFIS
jgi:hypothetical protein